jgi:hypothetical protein
MHFADFVPRGLPLIWTHATVNVRHFIKDYSLAVTVTAIFLLMLVGASVFRLNQHASLAKLLATVTSITQDYSSLVSNDKTAAPVRGDVKDDTTAQAPTGSSSSLAINSGGTTTSAGGSTNSGGTNTGGGGTTTTPPAVFGAAIAFFRQDSSALECSKSIPKKQFCSKRYVFSAAVNTQNGPGSVSYGWRSNITGANQDGSYNAASGSSQQTLQKEVVLSCEAPASYSMQFVILAPSTVQSTTIAFSHECNSIL